MTKKKNVWVTPREDGKWIVRREGSTKPPLVVATQSEANKIASQIAYKDKEDHITKSRDGRIKSHYSNKKAPIQLREKLSQKRPLQVVAHPEGGWVVREWGSHSIMRIFSTQKLAINFARVVSKRKGAKLYIHGLNGMIREIDSYDKYPLPIKED